MPKNDRKLVNTLEQSLIGLGGKYPKNNGRLSLEKCIHYKKAIQDCTKQLIEMNKGAVKKKETLIAIAQFYASDEF